MPLPRDVRASIALNVSGEKPLLFVDYLDVAFLAAPAGADGLLQVSAVWRSEYINVDPVVRIEGLWFASRHVE